MRRVLAAAAVVALLALAACAPGPPAAPTAHGAPVAYVASNILRADYAGSRECAYCHRPIYAAWIASPMHRMTRRAGQTRVQAPFDGAIFRLAGDSVTVETRGTHHFMRILSAEGGDQLFRVTKVIGGRTREDYVGIDVSLAEDVERDPGHGAEKVLPISFVYATRSWRYKGYSVMIPERTGLGAGPVWAQHCLPCHNTLPYLSMVFDDLSGPRRESYQGTVSDDLLPPSRTATWRVTDPGGLEAALADEIQLLSGTRPSFAGVSLADALARAIRETRRRLQGGHLVEVGVGCESCHGGSAAHADTPATLPSFAPRSRVVAETLPPGAPDTRAEWVNRTCARCHTVLFSGYPWTWEGGRQDDAQPGGSSISSGEARDFLLGACSTRLACSDCHDPHRADARARLDAMATVAGNGRCVHCHSAYAAPGALAAHTHHRVDADGSSCIACHMPRKNMGLEYRLTRYHRVGSPDDPTRVQADRPLECALCHVDKSVEALVGTMERWWGRRYDRGALRALYGEDLQVNVLAATLARGKPHEQAVAVAVLGDHPAAGAAQLPAIAAQLAHEYPLVRYFAKDALERITGAAVPVDVNAPSAEAAQQARAWLAARPPPAATPP